MLSTDQAPSAKAWLMWALSLSFLLFQFMLQGSVSAMVPDLSRDFHVDVTQISLISSSYFWTYLLLQIPGGILVDRFGSKRLLLVGTVLCAGGTFLFSISHSVSEAVLARLLTGLGTAPALAAAFYLVGSWFSPGYFAFVIGLSEALAMLFGGLGGEVVSTLTHLFGWKNLFLYASVFCLGLTLLMALFLKDRPATQQKDHHNSSKLSVKNQLSIVLRAPQIWLCGLFSGLMFPLISVLGTYWCIPYVMTRFGVTIRVAALGNLALFLGAAVGCPVLGHLSDFFHRRKVMMAVGAFAAFAMISMALYIPALKFSVVVGLFFLSGLFASVYMLPFALVNEITPQRVRGTAMGFTNMMSIVIGAPLLTALVGVLLKTSAPQIEGVFPLSSYTLALSVLPLAFLLGLAVLHWIREPERNTAQCS